MSPASYQTAPPRDAVSAAAPAHWRTGALSRAGNGTRTRDPNLGKVVLYQLSYSRNPSRGSERALNLGPQPANRNGFARHSAASSPDANGGEGDRTPDLVNAIHALSQLSYAPAILPLARRERGRCTK